MRPAPIPSERPLRLLVVCQQAAELAQVRSLLASHPHIRFECRRIETIGLLETAVLNRPTHADAVLLWLDTVSDEEDPLLRRAVSALQDVPLILCCAAAGPEAALHWAIAGIDACLPRGDATPERLANTLLFGVARSRRALRAGHDELTGLPTRALWQDRLGHALRRCQRNRTLGAMMLIDIDDFKQVNDVMGHDVGDALLVEVAQRLLSQIRSRDTVARLGGDEFAVLLEDLTYPQAALRVARKIVKAAVEPVILARASLKITVSVGVAILSPDQDNIDGEWAHQASDIALYDAKQLGKNRFSLFTADMDRALLHSLELDSDLVRAVEGDEFILHYQPIVCAATGQLEGFEALLRWERLPGTIMTPDSFLPALERLGMMDRLGRRLFALALDQLGDWRTRTGLPLVRHVNLSATQMIDQDFCETLIDQMAEAGVPPSALTLELTETVAFRYGVLIEREFARLRRHGVRFAIDDFGTGYNSMTYLKQFRPDVVKIDRSFIATMDQSEVDAAIVRSQSVLASSLGIVVVAEGVETAAQLDALRDIGRVDMIQGYLTGRPMAAGNLEREFAPLCDALSLLQNG